MLRVISILLISLQLLSSPPIDIPDSKRALDVRAAVWPRIQKELANKKLNSSLNIFLRIFKEQGVLEAWVKQGNKYQLYKTYNICYFSGGLGTKTKEGDKKSPEGFYTLQSKQLNPMSDYHLAVNIGYPNQLERAKGYTGSDIMIHGRCASVGCYAMTDQYIEEIYTLMYKAFEAGQQSIALHIYPFRMDKAQMNAYASSPNMSFWNMLKPAYDSFEKDHVPPAISTINQQYRVGVK